MTRTSDNFRASALWQGLQKGVFAQAQTIDLATFRRPGTLNNRLSSWDPVARNQRNYKTVLFNMLVGMPERFFEIHKMLDTSVGAPVTVKARGMAVDLDYLQSIEEVLFLEKDLAGVASIGEIGAGFGRTAHVLLVTRPQLTRYTIIDLPECLALSQRYLKRVLRPEDFRKLEFVQAEQASGIPPHDLLMNINSMAEMDREVIQSYFELIDRSAQWFYSKNTVGKYSPESIGIVEANPTEIKAAMSTGLLTEVIDIFDDAALREARKRYEERMRPSSGWTLVRSAPALPWLYYQHGLYRKA
ncbi:MAG: putative sugar O-methyltransferase [Planctomycetes bacterium]|nr:putative sugar O-methyltransferase [Planctomycetota bacterium]